MKTKVKRKKKPKMKLSPKLKTLKKEVQYLPKDEFCSGDYGVDKAGGLKTN